MQVTAALPWYDEPPDQLRDCIQGIACIADRLVCADGPYRRYPHTSIHSPQEQHRAIRETAEQTGLELTILTIDRPWLGQVEKRSMLLAAASYGSDWIVTVDADHVISTDRVQARAELERMKEDVVEVVYLTPNNKDRPMEISASGLWHQQVAGTVEMIPHLYRPLPGLHIERYHYWYQALKDRKWVWMWAEEGVPQLDRGCFVTPYVVEHRCLFREQKQILANRAFCNDRQWVVEQTGQEDHMPGMPEPIYDFESLAP